MLEQRALPASASRDFPPPLAELAAQAWLLGFLRAVPQVVIKHGLPRFRPFPAALKQWVMPASASTDFQYLLLSVLFLQARPMALASLLRSLYCSTLSAAYCLSLPPPVSTLPTGMTTRGSIQAEAHSII